MKMSDTSKGLSNQDVTRHTEGGKESVIPVTQEVLEAQVEEEEEKTNEELDSMAVEESLPKDVVFLDKYKNFYVDKDTLLNFYSVFDEGVQANGRVNALITKYLEHLEEGSVEVLPLAASTLFTKFALNSETRHIELVRKDGFSIKNLKLLAKKVVEYTAVNLKECDVMNEMKTGSISKKFTDTEQEITSCTLSQNMLFGTLFIQTTTAVMEPVEEEEWLDYSSLDYGPCIYPVANPHVTEGYRNFADIYNKKGGENLVEGQYLLNEMLDGGNVIDLCKEQVRYVMPFKLGAAEVVPDMSTGSSPRKAGGEQTIKVEPYFNPGVLLNLDTLTTARMISYEDIGEMFSSIGVSYCLLQV